LPDICQFIGSRFSLSTGQMSIAPAHELVDRNASVQVWRRSSSEETVDVNVLCQTNSMNTGRCLS